MPAPNGFELQSQVVAVLSSCPKPLSALLGKHESFTHRKNMIVLYNIQTKYIENMILERTEHLDDALSDADAFVGQAGDQHIVEGVSIR